MKSTFVKLVRLLSITYDGETAESARRWRSKVLNSASENGYTYEDFEIAEFDCSELELTDDVTVYSFFGSASSNVYEEETFYKRDFEVFKHKASGAYYVLDTDQLDT